MSDIKILVTGNTIGPSEVSPFSISQYDFNWVITNPSAFLWADKIILTPFINELIESEEYPDSGGKISKSLNKIFEVAKDHNLIDIKSPKNIIDEKVSENIARQVASEREYLLRTFPKFITAPSDATHGEIIIDGHFYCYPEIWTMCANLILAREWNAQSLFSDPVQNYCKYKFGVSRNSNEAVVNAFSQIFSIKMPQTLLFPQIVFKEIAEKGITPCSTCDDKDGCEEHYLNLTETKISKYLEMRDFDEIKQLRKVIFKIVDRIEKVKSEKEYPDIVSEFHKEQTSAEKELKLVFPKISYWADIGMIASTPFHFVGAATGLPIISLPADAILGLSAVTRAAIELQKNQYKWIAFNQGYSQEKTRIRLIPKDDI
jgi:hypothetical protein